MIWKPIPGYSKYEISILGEIRRVYKTCKRIMKQQKNDRNVIVIRLMSDKGQRKEERVHKLMQKTYMDEAPGKDYVLYHRNGIKTDNCLTNLKYIKKSKLGKITGAKSNRKPVRKLDPETKEIINFYKSAREAGRKNYLSYQTVMDYCNNKVKKNIAPDGYIYEWDK